DDFRESRKREPPVSATECRLLWHGSWTTPQGRRGQHCSANERRSRMSKQTDYTPEEWKTISAAPVLAGLLVSVSDMSGPIGLTKEAFAVVKGVTESSASTSNELIKTL